MPKTKIPELLAPAGDWPCLDAAIDAGADAVYFGVRGLNMRAAAKNFGVRDLKKIVAKCHAAGVRAYLTLNVVVFDRELELLKRLLKAAKAAAVDAVIAADLAVVSEARKMGLSVHASTQMSVANSAAMELLCDLGVTRFVLARECGIADIKQIGQRLRKRSSKQATKVQIEVFGHGAMCVSVSGRCFLSNFECGKSANRGECVQPCRRKYRVVEERGGTEWVVADDHILSPGDLCTLPFLEKLIAAGIDSLKIEGRNRGPEYVATVVSAYRRALDFYAGEKGTRGFGKRWLELKAELKKSLTTVYHRELTSGFYLGKPIGKWLADPHSLSPFKKCFVGTVLNYYRRPGVAEILVQDEPFSIGDELSFEGSTTGHYRQKVGSLQVEGKSVDHAAKGMAVGMKVGEVVRRGDKLYVMRPRTAR
jgi:putative protease